MLVRESSMSVRRTAHRPKKHADYWIIFVYGLNAMGAYQILSIPVQWLGSAISVIAVTVSFSISRRYQREEFYPLLLVLVMFVAALAGWLSWMPVVDFEEKLPQRATTTYFWFIFLRYFQILVFAAVYWLCIDYLKRNALNDLARLVIWAGLLVSAYALYVYVAQIGGLPEIPRNRMGTTGEQQAVSFSYAFHRAMGSFREPSHLAEWLVLPIFMTFISRSVWCLVARVALIAVVLLSGSMTGIAAIILGYVTSLFVVGTLWRAVTRGLVFLSSVLGAGLVFVMFVVPNPGGSVDILSVIDDRLRPILFEGGLLSSNRAYVYEFVSESAVPVFGYGFGNGNILFGSERGLGFVESFLSLYVNMLYALGYFGFVFFVLFLSIPIIGLIRCRRSSPFHVQALFGAYIAWLVVYAVHSEELSVSFAVLYAACVDYYVKKRCLRRGLSGFDPN